MFIILQITRFSEHNFTFRLPKTCCTAQNTDINVHTVAFSLSESNLSLMSQGMYVLLTQLSL